MNIYHAIQRHFDSVAHARGYDDYLGKDYQEQSEVADAVEEYQQTVKERFDTILEDRMTDMDLETIRSVAAEIRILADQMVREMEPEP